MTTAAPFRFCVSADIETVSLRNNSLSSRKRCSILATPTSSPMTIILSLLNGFVVVVADYFFCISTVLIRANITIISLRIITNYALYKLSFALTIVAKPHKYLLMVCGQQQQQQQNEPVRYLLQTIAKNTGCCAYPNQFFFQPIIYCNAKLHVLVQVCLYCCKYLHNMHKQHQYNYNSNTEYREYTTYSSGPWYVTPFFFSFFFNSVDLPNVNSALAFEIAQEGEDAGKWMSSVAHQHNLCIAHNYERHYIFIFTLAKCQRVNACL